jgi:type IV pilus assembly protein PilA
MRYKIKHKNLRYAYYGFTLIELMIVIGIIGILSVVAIPQYTNYVARAQVMEAFNLLGGAKMPIADFVANHGAFPTTAELHANYPVLQSASGDVSGNTKFLNSITTSTNSGVFSVTALFKKQNVHSLIAEQKVIFTAQNAGATAWACTSSIQNKDVLPSVCR